MIRGKEAYEGLYGAPRLVDLKSYVSLRSPGLSPAILLAVNAIDFTNTVVISNFGVDI